MMAETWCKEGGGRVVEMRWGQRSSEQGKTVMILGREETGGTGIY